MHGSIIGGIMMLLSYLCHKDHFIEIWVGTHLLGYGLTNSIDLCGPHPRIALLHRLTEPRTDEGGVCYSVHLKLRMVLNFVTQLPTSTKSFRQLNEFI